MKRVFCLLLLAACRKDAPPAINEPIPPPSSSVVHPASTGSVGTTVNAEINEPAPGFALKDLDGNEVRLSSFKGKTVVLEWFNPGCPFVKKSHTKASLKGAAKKHPDVVWLAINSNGPGKQGNGVEANREGAKTFGMSHPILLDESGAVGKAYGATNTPHMFVIDPKGILIYAGAIDNSPDGEGESAPDGKLVVYVEEALAALAAGKTPATQRTKAYGCGVKYASP